MGNGPMIQAAFPVHPRLGVPFPRRSIISLFRSFSTRETAGSNTLEQPRSLPTSGFEVLESDRPVEEKELHEYREHRFYPVRMGEIFQDRYQVVTKLGFGSCSTNWLARDLRDHLYVALKVYVNSSLVHRELPCYHHISPRVAESSHQGRGNIRRFLDSFEITGPHGKHIILVLEAAQMSLFDMKHVFQPNGFHEEVVRGAMTELLEALDFLHTEGEVIHTDVHYGNMLLGSPDNNMFHRLEEGEMTSPVTRKPVSPDRTIYLSRLIATIQDGPLLLSDFGEAAIGPGPHSGEIMPREYRAPEILLHVEWSYPVDVWSAGLTAWELLEPNRLFTARDENGDANDAAHLAQLIAALGPPPREFLAKNPERKSDFWDDQGEWLGAAPIPHARTLEALETESENKSGFLQFLRKALTWMPEERATAKELLQDPWLTGKQN
ncbi:serine/threonine-protein kinase [Xylona heveae TC161]|uniref:non-specific serine/threonine protein kinase n=1 Tax=Xylona heveae (strain CBS 132557 / TC161) TaxID=1328760 RepID=A0A165GDV4_XYLHT|nr:serine/threonine-protein kinase [Xylona heveae TC161]KZF22072.1 serine/threonine-protein kinase [Xylona heveae TC161]